MRRAFLVAMAVIGATCALLSPQMASAQYSDSFNFLKAVRDADAAAAMKFLNRPGSVIVNTRDTSNGETGLIIATRRRDLGWMGLLLTKGANPNLSDDKGNTPLMTAVRLHFLEGAQVLASQGAQIDKAGGSGETPLIQAVQLRDLPLVRFLVGNGADPDKRDLTGMSARDYAKSDPRGGAMLDGLNEAKPVKSRAVPVQGPVL